MNIIFDKSKLPPELDGQFIIFKLENIDVDGTILEPYCVVEASNVPDVEIEMLDHWRKFHNEFLKANEEQNYNLCRDIAEHLMGKFGGELDSFYQIVCERDLTV
jgi:hypothetical protein